MTTITAHKVLITTALVFSLAPIVWGIARFSRHGETDALAVSAGGVVAAIFFALYLRSFLARHRDGT